MQPRCACPCGAKLELRHAKSREKLSEEGNWTKWRLRFRCPRCRREVVREFDSRCDKSETQPLEVYERADSAVLGAIEPGEEELLWIDPRALHGWDLPT